MFLFPVKDDIGVLIHAMIAMMTNMLTVFMVLWKEVKEVKGEASSKSIMLSDLYTLVSNRTKMIDSSEHKKSSKLTLEIEESNKVREE